MDQELIAAVFRAQELTRRSERRSKLLQQVANELALNGKELSAEEKEAHRKAIKGLLRMEINFRKESSLSYWQKLWLALIGRL